MRIAVLIGLMMFWAGVTYELGLSLYWSLAVGVLPLVVITIVVAVDSLWLMRKLKKVR